MPPSGPIPYGTQPASPDPPNNPDFPKWLFNAAGESVLVQNANELSALPPNWTTDPGVMSQAGAAGNPDIVKFLPVVSTDEALLDCRVQDLYLINVGDAPADVFVYDRAVVPVPLVVKKALPPGGIIHISSQDGFRMTAGLTWWASTPQVSGRVLLSY